ncbi:hypothetical protein Tco_1027995 [Tanacetum coccineum]
MAATQAVQYAPQCGDLIVESVTFHSNNFKVWCTAIAYDLNLHADDSEVRALKEYKIKFTVMNGKNPLTIDFKTFCEATGLDYNKGTYMALPVLNINYSASRSMFKREKLSSSNFNDWFRSLKLVLRVEKKLFVIEQPISLAPPIDSIAQVLPQWNAVYDAHNEVACLMLGSMTLELHRQFENSSPYEMLQ